MLENLIIVLISLVVFLIGYLIPSGLIMNIGIAVLIVGIVRFFSKKKLDYIFNSRCVNGWRNRPLSDHYLNGVRYCINLRINCSGCHSTG